MALECHAYKTNDSPLVLSIRTALAMAYATSRPQLLAWAACCGLVCVRRGRSRRAIVRFSNAPHDSDEISDPERFVRKSRDAESSCSVSNYSQKSDHRTWLNSSSIPDLLHSGVRHTSQRTHRRILPDSRPNACFDVEFHSSSQSSSEAGRTGQRHGKIRTIAIRHGIGVGPISSRSLRTAAERRDIVNDTSGFGYLF